MTINVRGTVGSIPQTECILVSADDRYFIDHGPSFVYSAANVGHDVHVNIINPSPTSLAMLGVLERDISTALTFTSMTASWSNIPHEQLRTFFACSRFFVSLFLFEAGAKEMWISDIDAVFTKKLPSQTTEGVRLFSRPNEPMAEMKFAAGLLYLSGADGRLFVQTVCELISKSGLTWFIDQLAILQASTNHKWKPLPPEAMDWNFGSDSCLWTGKGDRKYSNKTYIDYKNSVNKLHTFERRVWESNEKSINLMA